jgi:hypothetical protein
VRASLLAAIFLVACLDPEAPPGEGGPAASGGGAPTAPPPQGDGAPAAEGGGTTAPPAFELPTIVPGTGVKLSGTTTYAGTKKGKVRIDVLSLKDGATMPGLVATTSVDAIGAWEIEIPKNAGDVHVVAFLDLANNGPDTTDPAGRTKDPVKMGEAAVGGVSVTIEDAADLGDLTPGNSPHSDKEKAPLPDGPAKPADGAPTAPPADGTPADAKAAAPVAKAGEATPADPKAAATESKPADVKAGSAATPPAAAKPDTAKPDTAKPAATGGRTKPSGKKPSTSDSESTGGAKPASTGK